MNAAALRSFADQSARTGEAMWPGEVIIAGEPYPCEVAQEPKLTTDTEDGGGGSVEEGELVVKIRKAVLAEKPTQDALLTFKGKKYRMDVVTGDKDASAVWLVECARES